MSKNPANIGKGYRKRMLRKCYYSQQYRKYLL